MEKKTKASLGLNGAVVNGAPISAVSLAFDGVVVYGMGDVLHRVGLKGSSTKQEHDWLSLQSGQSIHGIRQASESLAIIFGGRFVHFVGFQCSERQQDQPIQIWDVDLSGVLTPCLRRGDWIWDCRLIRATNKILDSTRTLSTALLMIGLAHNQVELWRITFESPCDNRLVLNHVSTYRGETRCILYCLDIGANGRNIAAGTVMNEIVVWEIPDTEQSGEQHPTTTDCSSQHRLCGHKGVIHRVKFDTDCMHLASTSDDRSVRLWTRQQDDSWVCLWNVFGHNARGWNVAFANDCIISTGEDGTVRLWNVDDGKALGVMRGHNCW